MSPTTKRNRRKSKSKPHEQNTNNNPPSSVGRSEVEIPVEEKEPARVVAQPSMETVNGEPKEKQSPRGNKKYTNRLEVVRKISMQLDVSDERFLTVLETILALHEGMSPEKALRLQVVDVLLTQLKTSDKEEVKALLNICKNSFLQDDFKKCIVDGASLYTDGKILGEGGFGVVHLGKLRKADGSWIEVAVKKPSTVKQSNTCLEEAKIMMRFDHENVIKILGFRKNPPRIAMEYMDWGNLHDALQDHHFTDVDLLNALHDVASGMEHVAEMKYVHRDLACKNIFVNSKKQCKVGDFGLSKYMGETSENYEEKEGVILMYNTAPEAKALQLFSTKSDVWSMGVLMWELYFMAHPPPVSPFQIFGRDVFQVPFHIKLFQLNGRLYKPTRCPDCLFQYISTLVLHNDPERRPTFTAIKKTITRFIAVTKSKSLRDMD